MWLMGTRLSGGLGRAELIPGLHLKALFQPKQFNDFKEDGLIFLYIYIMFFREVQHCVSMKIIQVIFKASPSQPAPHIVKPEMV